MESPNSSMPNNRSQNSIPNSSSCLKNSTKINQMEKQEKMNLVLDLSLSSKDFEAKTSQNRVFSCKYWTSKFYSSQALGGHQNAHKQERGRQQRHRVNTAAHHRYSPLALHGSLSRSFGMQVHSMMHKPIVRGVPIYGWKPAVWRLAAENHRPASSGAARFHGGGWRVPTAVDGSGGIRTNQEELKKLDLSLKL